MGKHRVIRVYISEEMEQPISQLVKKYGISESEIIRHMMIDYLEFIQHLKTPSNLK